MRTLSDIAPEVNPMDFAADVAAILSGEASDSSGMVDEAETAPAPAETTTEQTQVTEPVADEHGNLHDPETGKFLGRAQEEQEQGAEAEETTDEEQPEGEGDLGTWDLDISDPRLAAYIDKYGGDLTKALAAAVEAQSTLGRQGSELGELRKLQGELQAMKDMLPQLVAARQPAAPAVDYARLIEEDPKRAAIMAEQNGDYEAMGYAVRAWAAEGTEEAFEASMFASNIMHQAELARLREEFTNAQPQPSAADLDQEVAAVIKRHPDIENRIEEIGAIAQSRPALRTMLESGSPAEKAAALEDLYMIATSRSAATDTSQAVRKVQARVSDEARQAKADAAVVSASGSSAASGSQPTRVDTFLDAFETRMQEKGLLAKDE